MRLMLSSGAPLTPRDNHMTETRQVLLPSDLIDRMDAAELDKELRNTRANLTKAQAKLRQTINGGGLVYRVGYAIDRLLAGYEEQDVMGVRTQVPLDLNRIAALKAGMDGSLRMLDKILPSLKSIEVQGDMPAGALAAATGGTTIKIVTAVPRDPSVGKPPQEPVSFA